MSAGYKLATYASPMGPRAGIIVGETLYDAAGLTGQASDATVLGILEDWDAAAARCKAAAAGAKEGKSDGTPLAQANLLTPVRWPSAIYCAGANFTDHMMEMAKVQNIAPEPDPHERRLEAVAFHQGVAHRSRDPGKHGEAADLFEDGRLGGRARRRHRPPGKQRAARARARLRRGLHGRQRSFGARPHQAGAGAGLLAVQVRLARARRISTTPARSARGSCRRRTSPDPQNVAIKLWVNDVIKQDSHTSKMIFTLAEQISHLSSRLTLHPGDLILTGTPAGVGLARKEFLKAGDVVKVWVEGVGTLTNTMG